MEFEMVSDESISNCERRTPSFEADRANSPTKKRERSPRHCNENSGNETVCPPRAPHGTIEAKVRIPWLDSFLGSKELPSIVNANFLFDKALTRFVGNVLKRWAIFDRP
jgi:hypothetical protein